ncbi:tudor and KH domain-containing protein isoform X2 [Arvicola amphibius]|uniref:tudor and KH domain-containing protein isoform X2 n=1 Tax=Arvicola amphibius TaxID=1047088 RepID=UPI0018E2C974|nr:tudor and KH domain-containing protein isoform X2 [Arvicola amphibius]
MATEQTSWTSLSTIQKIALGLGIPASATVAYILYRRYRESREERLTFVGEDDIEIEMRVPQEAVKLIIGRQGANIKQLRKQTGARIDVDTEDVGDERVLLISGFPVQGEVARLFALSVRPLEPKSLVTKNQTEPYYFQDL